jgi:hypothetical protein
VAFVAQLEHEGDHRQARIHRLSQLDLGEQVCRELGLDVTLLAELDPPQVAEDAPASGGPYAPAVLT